MRFSFYQSVSLTFFALSNIPVIAGTYDYVLPKFASSLEACQSRAPTIASDFATAAQVEIIHAGCSRGEVLHDVSVHITYAAPELVKTVGTYDREITTTYTQTPYTSLNDCMNRINEERAVFEAHTQLLPFVTYCFSDIHRRRFGVGIEAVGDPEVRPFVTNLRWMGSLTKDWSVESVNLLKRAAVAEWKAPQVWGASDSVFVRVGFRYYASKRSEPLSDSNIYKYHEQTRCEQAARQVHDALGDVAGQFTHVTCTRSVGRYYLEPYFDEQAKIRLRTFAQLYANLDLCAGDLNRLQEALQGSIESKILGGFCSQDDQGAAKATLLIQETE